jgi:hypothetical protein
MKVTTDTKDRLGRKYLHAKNSEKFLIVIHFKVYKTVGIISKSHRNAMI